MSFGMTNSLKVPGGGAASYNFDQCLYTIMVIGKCTDVFIRIFLDLGRGG